MRKVLVSLSLGFLFLVFASYSSYAETCRCAGKEGMGMRGEGMPMMRGMERCGMETMKGAEHHMWRHLTGLGLDEKQMEAVKDVKSRVIKDTIRKRADLQIARVELREILDKDPVDLNKAEAKLKQIASSITDIRLSHIKAMEEIKAQLTPEQREKFKKSLKRHWRTKHGRTMHREKKEKMPE